MKKFEKIQKLKKSSYSQTHVLWVATVLHWVNIDASSEWGLEKSTKIHGLRHSTAKMLGPIGRKKHSQTHMSY